LLGGCTGGDATGRPEAGAPFAPVESRATVTVAPVPGARRSVSRGFRDGDAGTQTVDPTLYPPISAVATFHATATSMDLTATASGCEPFLKGYPVRIHAGTSCADPKSLGADLDRQEAGAEPLVNCNGTSGTGATYYSRPDADAQPWTFGGSASTNILGRVLVIHDPVSGEPLACGVIPTSPTSPPDAGPIPPVALNLKADLAVACTLSLAAPDASPSCPDRQALVDCATDHCSFSECLSSCTDYLACLKTEPDPCSPAHCTMDSACSACTGALVECMINFCLDQLGCGHVSPGGPCSKVESCCELQGDYEQSCLRLVHEGEKLSGDPTCVGTMHDWDFNTHIPVPCNFGP
jgi:hypothetical protein